MSIFIVMSVRHVVIWIMDQNTTAPQEQNTPPIPEEPKIQTPMDPATEAVQYAQLPQDPTNTVPQSSIPQNPPEISTSTPLIPPQEPVKKKSRVFTIAIIMLLISILALAGYFLWINYFGGGKPAPTPTPVVTIAPTPTSDPTANWETYLDSENGFSFKYPSDWVMNQSTQVDGILNMVETENCYSIDFRLLPNISDSLGQYVSDTYGNNEPQLKENFTSSLSEVSVIGPQGVGEVKSILFKNDDYIIQATVIKNRDVSCAVKQYDQILSTFQFVEPGIGSSISGSYTIQIPISWQDKYIKVLDNINNCDSYTFKGVTKNSYIFNICKKTISDWDKLQNSSTAHPTEESVLAKNDTFVYYSSINVSNDYSGDEATAFQSMASDVSSILETFKLN